MKFEKKKKKRIYTYDERCVRAGEQRIFDKKFGIELPPGYYEELVKGAKRNDG